MANKVITKFDVDGTGSNNFTIRPTHAYMGTCTTAGSTAAKTVTITPAVDNFLEAGVRITVYFSNANNATNPTLSINSGTAKNIYKGSSAITAKLLSIGYHDFIYDGTQWQYVGSYIDTNTTYSAFTTAAAGLTPASGANTAKFLRGDGTWQTPTDIDNKVQQSISRTGNYRPIILGHQYGNAGFEPTDEINVTYVNKRISASPATGKILAGGYIISGAATNAFVKADGTAAVPTNTTYSTFSTAVNGLVPKPAAANTGKYLRGDGSWQVPENTQYHTLDSNHFDTQEPHVVYGPGHFDHHLFLNGEGSWSIPQDTTYANISASNTTTNASYTVPGAGANTGCFLRGDGSWSVPANTTYTTFSTAVNGLVPKPTAANTAKFLRGDGSWVAPSNTTYNNLSASNTATGTKYTVLGAGANTFKFLRGDGSWQTPANTTYTTFTTAAAGLTPASGANTAKFLRGDGSWVTPYTTFTTAAAGLTPTSPGGTAKYLRADGTWQTPANTTYAVLSSSSTSNGSYVVNGVGDSTASTKYFLRGDGRWHIPPETPIPEIMQGYAVGQNKNSNTEVDTIYYEYSRSNDADPNIRNIIFRDKDDTELLADSLVNNHVYYFVFRNGLPSSQRIVLTDTQTHNQISFLRDETSNHWLQRGQDDFSLFPTHIVISFKKTTYGLVYLGPIPVFNMLSAVNTYGERGHLVPGAGANTGCFLRGDGAWHSLPISNKIVKEFECETLANIPYSSATNFVGGKMEEALQIALHNINDFASTQEILFKFNGRMGYFYEQRELMIIELLWIFNDMVRQFLNDMGYEYHITVKFEFTPEDRYSVQQVEIAPIVIDNYNKLEIIEANDNTSTLTYDTDGDRLFIRDLQGNYLNILTYRLDCHNVSPNPKVSQYSVGTQVSLKQYSMIFHKYSTVVA